jgi:hypothetical protein
VRLCKLRIQLTHTSKPPGFCSSLEPPNVISCWFQAFAFACNLHRYTTQVRLAPDVQREGEAPLQLANWQGDSRVVADDAHELDQLGGAVHVERS